LHDSVQTAFQNLGGTVTAGYRYEPTTTDFGAATAAINSQVAGAQLVSSPSTIGVYLAAFDEVVGVFHSAQADPTLAATAWYGSDGVALSAALVGDSEAAAFATTAGYPNPIFGLEDSLQSKWQPVANAIQARTGIEPDAYALSAYDALFIVDRASQEAGGPEDFHAFKAAFVHVADTYTGVTGSTALDAAGTAIPRTLISGKSSRRAARTPGSASEATIMGRCSKGLRAMPRLEIQFPSTNPFAGANLMFATPRDLGPSKSPRG